MVICRGVKLKLYPTYNQHKDLIEESSRVRFLWNMFIELNLYNMVTYGKRMTYFEMCKKLTEIKNDEYLGWYKYPSNSQMSQQTLKRLDTAYSRWFNKTSKEPKYKSKKKSTISLTYPQGIRFNYNNTKLFIPSIGEVRCRGYRHFKNMVIKQLIITIEPKGNIRATITVECENQTPNFNSTFIPMVGIDVGTKKFLTDNRGIKILPTNDIVYKNILTGKVHFIKKINLKQELIKLNRLQKIASSRLTANSKNKAYCKVNKQSKHITNIRNNWLHHVANMYKDYSKVYIEDLNINTMVINPVDNKNINTKRKTNLNRLILQQSWGVFFTILEYKLKDNNNELVRVDPKYTSQMCSKCLRVNKLNRVGEVYTCDNCGIILDSDYNASINILNKGMKFSNIPGNMRELNNMYI